MRVLERGNGVTLIEKTGKGRDNAVFHCENFGTIDHQLRVIEKPGPFGLFREGLCQIRGV